MEDEENSTTIRCSKQPKSTHDYRLLDDPWVDDNEISMLSANRVYTTYCDIPVTPNNPKSLAEAWRSPEWPD